MTLRSNAHNSSTQTSYAASMRKNSTTSPGSLAVTSPTKSGSTLASQNSLNLKLQTMTTATGMPTTQQSQPALVHSPPSPQSPHTMATKCGFSPNVTTQSCMVIDDKDAQIKSLQGEIVSLKDVIKSRDAEIVKLRREIHKLKVSFCAKSCFWENFYDSESVIFKMRYLF